MHVAYAPRFLALDQKSQNWDLKMLILQIASLLALHFPLSPHGSYLRFRKPGIVYEACVGSVLLVAYEKTEFDTVAS
jgi:hypothetical protein